MPRQVQEQRSMERESEREREREREREKEREKERERARERESERERETTRERESTYRNNAAAGAGAAQHVDIDTRAAENLPTHPLLHRPRHIHETERESWGDRYGETEAE
jgi:hypothetical protein